MLNRVDLTAEDMTHSPTFFVADHAQGLPADLDAATLTYDGNTVTLAPAAYFRGIGLIDIPADKLAAVRGERRPIQFGPLPLSALRAA